MDVRNVYSCGCVRYNVSAVSRCEQHDQLVICRWSTDIEDNQKVNRNNYGTIAYIDARVGLAKIKSESIAVICSYPNQSEFYARQASSFLRMPDMFFEEYYRILQDDGLLVLFVEPICIASAVYSAVSNNFNVNSISQVIVDVTANCYHTIGPKLCLVLGKSNTKGLANFKFSERSNLFSTLQLKGTVLDTTCLVPEILMCASKTNKVIGLCYEPHIFKQLSDYFR